MVWGNVLKIDFIFKCFDLFILLFNFRGSITQAGSWHVLFTVSTFPALLTYRSRVLIFSYRKKEINVH